MTVRNLDYDPTGANCAETYLLLSGFNTNDINFRTLCGNEETFFRGELTNKRTFALELFSGSVAPLRGFELVVKAIG